MPEGTLRIEGYAQLMRATRQLDRETRLSIRHELKHTGDIVRADAAARMASKHSRSAAGLKVRVRQRGVAVEQSLRKTTGRHPEWGAWQMRHALIPALAHQTDETEQRLEHTMNRIADHFNRVGSGL